MTDERDYRFLSPHSAIELFFLLSSLRALCEILSLFIFIHFYFELAGPPDFETFATTQLQ